MNELDPGTETDVNDEASTTSETSKQVLTMNDIVDDKGVPLTNRFAEMSRKLNQLPDLASKIDQLLNTTAKVAQPTAGDYGDYSDDAEIDKRIESRLAQERRKQLQEQHFQEFNNFKQQYPELDSNSPEYDHAFYNMANNYYLTMGFDAKPDGVREAVEYAAFKTGRAKADLQKEMLSDEARRSRKIAEGASNSKKAKAGDDDEESLRQASKHFRINPKYFKKAKAQLGQRGA